MRIIIPTNRTNYENRLIGTKFTGMKWSRNWQCVVYVRLLKTCHVRLNRLNDYEYAVENVARTRRRQKSFFVYKNKTLKNYDERIHMTNPVKTRCALINVIEFLKFSLSR